MPLYRVVTGAGNPVWGDGIRSDAEFRAKTLSANFSDRYYVYWVCAVAPGHSPGRLVWAFVRGEKCAPDQVPRVEVWSKESVMAMVPVVGGDENWSQCAGALLKQAYKADSVHLVRPLTEFVVWMTTTVDPIEVTAENPAAAVMEAIQREIAVGHGFGLACSLKYKDPLTGRFISGDALLAAIPGTTSGPVFQEGAVPPRGGAPG